MKPTNTAWDLGRFLQTLAYFEVLPLWRCLRRGFGGVMPQSESDGAQDRILFDFAGTPASTLENTWGVLDDVVMGGVSASTIQQAEDGALFSGIVSTANSGGFASVRSRNFEPPIDLTGATGIKLRVKGDGNRYKFLVRCEDKWDSVAYSYSFDTEGDRWIDVHIPFSAMIPVLRAKTQPDAPPLNLRQICSFQLMLSKFEYDGALNPTFTPGAFTLSIQSICAEIPLLNLDAGS